MGSNNKFSLILGSQSPRRKELLSWLALPFCIVSADLEEVSVETEASDIAVDLASQKAHAVFNKITDIDSPFVIASDTIVVSKGKIYGKPKNLEEARKILLELSDCTHQVITGVSFLFFDPHTQKKREHFFYDSTEVTFSEITPDLMEA